MAGRSSGWLDNFMQGRYGVDDYTRSLSYWAIGLLIASVIANFASGIFGSVAAILSMVLNALALALIVYMFSRVLSRNHDRRRQENRRYLERKMRRQNGKGRKRTNSENRTSGWGRRQQDKAQQAAQEADLENYKYLCCPFCDQKLRVPRGKGKVAVKCPRCGEKTIVNS